MQIKCADNNLKNKTYKNKQKKKRNRRFARSILRPNICMKIEFQPVICNSKINFLKWFHKYCILYKIKMVLKLNTLKKTKTEWDSTSDLIENLY